MNNSNWVKTLGDKQYWNTESEMNEFLQALEHITFNTELETLEQIFLILDDEAYINAHDSLMSAFTVVNPLVMIGAVILLTGRVADRIPWFLHRLYASFLNSEPEKEILRDVITTTPERERKAAVSFLREMAINKPEYFAQKVSYVLQDIKAS